jgi:anthranilate phosphoribosyltransferase
MTTPIPGEAIRGALVALVDQRRDLTEAEAAACMEEIMGEGATASQFGAFVTALRLKGETVDEITGMARVMRAHALKVEVQTRPVLDTCGTGGDGLRTFNASTAAAFAVAAAGGRVAKHGNRAASSQSGSADVLEALGAEIALSPQQVSDCIERTGVGFMFAQAFHPAMKFAGPLRRELGIRTVFNILGPLTNPASANCQVLGVPTVELAEKMAGVLSRLGLRHALVVTGEQGLDEISVSGPTTAYEVRGTEVTSRRITPDELGLNSYPLSEVVGGTPQENAATMRKIFTGEGPAAVRDFVAANAGAGLYVLGLAASLRQGVEQARAAMDNGDAAARLGAFVEATRRA